MDSRFVIQAREMAPKRGRKVSVVRPVRPAACSIAKSSKRRIPSGETMTPTRRSVVRERHIAVDTGGRLLMVNLTTPDISDSAGAQACARL
jgi:hypothetical protein